ncbi:MAG: hypothetical protein KKH72_02815 [Alphaproteobacteria bacterium]|nr:hypothetical protein [Alphaproteobacteria bacterium]
MSEAAIAGAAGSGKRTAGAAITARSIPLAPALIIAAYLVLEIVMFAHRDAWLDEAQAWSWATTLADPADFLVVPGEGHPPLWFWVLRLLSLVVSFDQARLMTLGIAALNAVLLARYAGSNLVVLAFLLFSNIVLHSWGYEFRPYALLLTMTLVALELSRGRRHLAGAWVLAIACGFHFFAGFLFGLYLLVNWQRGLSFRSSIPPMLVGLSFGAMAVLSGLGTPAAEVSTASWTRVLTRVFTDPFWLGSAPDWAVSGAVVLLAGFGLRNNLDVAWPLAAITALFLTFATLVYGVYAWHTAFLVVFLLMAFSLAGEKVPRWPLVLLLLPQIGFGLLRTGIELSKPPYGAGPAVAIVREDAGPGFASERQLVAWPDTAMVAVATSEGFDYLGANGQRHLDTLNWRERDNEYLDIDLLATTPTPYWLICYYCDSPIIAINAAGRGAELVLAPPEDISFRPIHVYRIVAATPVR